MTGHVFMHILKYKEIESAKNASKSKGRNKKKDQDSQMSNNSSSQASINPNSLRHQPVDW